MEIKLCSGGFPYITLSVWSKGNAFFVPISFNGAHATEMQYSVLPF